MEIVIVLLKGLAAGFIGTIVLTLSETIDMKITKREGSSIPGQVGSKLFGIKPKNGAEMQSLNKKIHWGHGIIMGILRAVLFLFGFSGLFATIIHYVLVWGGDAMMYAALGVAPLPWKWKGQELLTDLFHKGVYVIATGIAFDLMT